MDDPVIRRWYDNLARGSRITADVYLRRVGSLCAARGTSFCELARMSEQDATNLLMDVVTEMEGRGHAGSYIESVVKALKSWLLHNRVDVRAYIKITSLGDFPTLIDEQVPVAEQLSKFFRACSLDARVAASLMAFSGVRPQAIGHYKGDNGLKISDFDPVMRSSMNVSIHFRTKYGGDLDTIGRVLGSEFSKIAPALPVGYSIFHLADVGEPFIVALWPTYSQP